MAVFSLTSSLPFPIVQSEVLAIDPTAILTITGIGQSASSGVPSDNTPILSTINVQIQSNVLIQSQVDALVGGATNWGAGAISRYTAARNIAKAIPNYATWTQSDLLNWYNNNISSTQINAVTSLAQAKVVMQAESDAIFAVAKMLLALRDILWPDLPDR